MKKILLFFTIILVQLFYSQSDCISAVPVCGNSSFSYNSVSSGSEAEDLMGCLSSDEHNSVWYTFTIATSGTLTFVINPNDYADDYDFGVYGPNQTCGALSPPIRCNYSGVDGPTGLDLTLTGNATSGTMSAYLDVLAGETYYLVIDNFLSSGNGFSLNWGGTATLTSAFNDPALTPFPFVTPGVPAANPSDPKEILKCALPTQFNFTTLSAGILNNNPNFVVTYHNTNNDAITGNNPLTTTTIDGTTTYYYRLRYQDPNNATNPINGCFELGEFKFKQGNIVALDDDLTECNNNGAGTATYNLTSAIVFADPLATKKYYPTLADLNANTNQIMNPTAYVSAEKTVYVLVTSVEGCTDVGEILLKFYPNIQATPAALESCYIESAVTTASFDLTSANVTSNTGITKKFYTSLANAQAGTNEILNPTAYITPSTEVYVRITSVANCYVITKISLKVLPPAKSGILKDKTICIEDRTTLDAGPGFDGYEWSTGATTQSIQGVGVGTYWVILKTGKCFTKQEVKVHANQQFVISNIDISNNTITVNVNSGTAPYQYSLDGITWQESNIFSNLPRGEVKVFVKDKFDCDPMMVEITVPNLINAITPNGDNINDEIDYSALAYKKNLVFSVYNRYGNKVHEADKQRNYKWDGTSGGKKLNTGTYWYTITWIEDNKENTPTKYTGWILLKNIE
ncbi:gliding motility-associated C-terminal domain-containing protein [Chryseobacterium sp.]|uniref:gliding motility-associated C-terminal domain-containing protein n=1 Tax=Chryseobacterium sp. TaxID=1871047 RepID=UPI0038904680